MSLEGWTTEKIEEYERQLMAAVPETGPIGNLSLNARLKEKAKGWGEDVYWDIRNQLIGRGLLIKGFGKGGSVRRAPIPVLIPVPEVQGKVLTLPAGEPLPEAALYGPMVEVIKTKWAQDHRLDLSIAEITAAQGSKQTGGKWTRPDITVASVKTFPYVPGRHFDITTFEIKPTAAVDVTAIYEALGHRRASTKAYALLYVPESKKDELQSTLDEIEQEAKRFGVGVIVAAEPGNYNTWDERVEPVRHEPDPERLNEFLSQQVSQGFREQFVKWFR